MQEFEEIQYFESKERKFGLIIGAIAMVAACIWIAYDSFMVDQNLLMGLFGVFGGLFFFAGFIMIIYKALASTPSLTLLEEHLRLYLSPHTPVDIHYEDIKEFTFYEISGNKHIGLIIENEEKYIDPLSDTFHSIIHANESMGFPNFNIVWGSVHDREEMWFELKERWEYYQNQKETLRN